MGGINSGARAITPSTDDCLRFTLTELRRQDALRRYQMSRQRREWHQYGVRVAEIVITSDIECLEPALCLRISGWAFASMSDEQLLYEADQSEGLVPEARDAMRFEFKKRAINFTDKLLEKNDFIKADGNFINKEQNSLNEKENKIIRWAGILIFIAALRYIMHSIR